MAINVKFQPTRPLRGATDITIDNAVSKKFQPTRPLRGATCLLLLLLFLFFDFNPRAPCGARRVGRGSSAMPQAHFNPRAPCGARLLAKPIPP